jgi:hypothetical protein
MLQKIVHTIKCVLEHHVMLPSIYIYIYTSSIQPALLLLITYNILAAYSDLGLQYIHFVKIAIIFYIVNAGQLVSDFVLYLNLRFLCKIIKLI